MPLSILNEAQRLKVDALAKVLNGDSTRRHIYSVCIHEMPHGRTQIKRHPEWEEDTTEDLEETTKPYVATDEEGRPLVIYMPDYFSNKAVKEVTSGLEKLHADIGVNRPKVNTRHGGLDVELERNYGPRGYGTLHCAAWFETGHMVQGPVVSREMCDGSKRLDATCRFVQSTGTLKQE